MKPPTINTAKDIAKTLNAKGVIVICFDEDIVNSASYGVAKKECRAIGRLLDKIIDQIESGELKVWD